MKVATVHYHLRRGGVTRVIRSAREALQDRGVEMMIISGEEPEPETGIGEAVVIPGLNYRKTAYLSVAASLKQALKSAAEQRFGSQPDVWHFHNHSLGKNVLMPMVISGLAEEKAKLLLQFHDFPEDGRPQNYVAQRSFFDLEKEFARTLYPVAPQVHYATINQRDKQFLRSAGIKNEQLHLLANSASGIEVTSTPEERPFSKDKRFYLYPTRAIRRKNLGEILLLALAHGKDIDFATSLIPENPDWKPIHDQWQTMSEELNLPITFGIGQNSDWTYADLIGWSDAHITTSVAEGFGLAFLEPWLSGKSVVGRNLPRITNDFTGTGINLDHMYERVNVPVEWIGKDVLRDEADRILRQIYLAYNFPLPKNAVDLTFSRWVEDDCVDFGMLNESFQREVIKKAASDPGALADLNLSSLEPVSDAVVEANKELVEAEYGLESYGDNLLTLYQKIAKGSAGKVKSLDPNKVLKQFLDPWRLNLLRT